MLPLLLRVRATTLGHKAANFYKSDYRLYFGIVACQHGCKRPRYKDVIGEGIAQQNKTWMDTICEQLLSERNEINDFKTMMDGFNRR